MAKTFESHPCLMTDHTAISMDLCKKDETSLLTHWSCVFLALIHRDANLNKGFCCEKWLLGCISLCNYMNNENSRFVSQETQTSLILVALNLKIQIFLVLACSCLCAIYQSQVFSRERRSSWSSADDCSNHIRVINNFIAYLGAFVLEIWQ